jgi:hypothetical protein
MVINEPDILWPYLSTDPAVGQQRLVACHAWVAQRMGVSVQWVMDTYVNGTLEQREEIKKMMALHLYEMYKSPFEAESALPPDPGWLLPLCLTLLLAAVIAAVALAIEPGITIGDVLWPK